MPSASPSGQAASSGLAVRQLVGHGVGDPGEIGSGDTSTWYISRRCGRTARVVRPRTYLGLRLAQQLIGQPLIDQRQAAGPSARGRAVLCWPDLAVRDSRWSAPGETFVLPARP